MSYYKVNKEKKSNLKYQYNIALFLIFMVFFNSCAKHNAGVVKQSYNDITSHYNGYFNAKENYNIQIKNLTDNRTDDYDQILPISSYGNIEDISSKNDALDISIEKARLVIQTHQEKKTGKNYKKNDDNSISNWADDAFLLIGKSYYMQGEMDSAISCFRYITANFEDGVDARSKKKIKKQKSNKKRKEKAKKKEKKQIEKEKDGKDIRPSKKLFVHEAAHSEALVWLAKAYVANEDYTEAQAVLTYIDADKNFLKNFDREVMQVNAMLNLKTNNYTGATSYIKKAIAEKKKQTKNARLQFILAQILEKQNNNEAAANYYKQSIKANNNFEMVFYAKLKLIQMSRKADNVDKATNKLIAKMLRDNKNKDFYDQLYFEKALIALQNFDRDDAKQNLLKSIQASTNNEKQKALSYIKLADLNYEEELYTKAQALYDSSLALIDTSFIDYYKVDQRASVLTDLVAKLNTIALNDSLLQLGSLDRKQLESLLYNKAVDEVDRQLKEEEENKQSALMAANSASSGKNNKGSWYFYSSASRSNGYKKFKQIWGDIVLEDNWRRSDKTSDAEFADDETDGDQQYFDRINTVYDAMLTAVPSSAEEKAALKDEIIDAYYTSGVIYKIDLENVPKSIEMFTKLNSLYSKNRHEAEVLYQLYILYSDKGLDNKAKDAKSELLSKYPNSKFAAYIKNPSLISSNSIEEIEDYYDNAYALYLSEEYDTVLSKIEQAKITYTNNPIQAKFDLLKAFAIGGKKEVEPFKKSLQYVINTHENTEEERKAREVIAYLDGENPILDKTKTSKESGLLDKGKINSSKQTKDKISQDKIKNIEKIDKDGKDGLKINIGSKEFQIGGKKKGQ